MSEELGLAVHSPDKGTPSGSSDGNTQCSQISVTTDWTHQPIKVAYTWTADKS